MRYKYTKEELENAVKKSLSNAGVCRELGILAAGGNYKTINAKIKEMGVDTSHFTGQNWNKGVMFKPFGRKYNLVDVLIEDSPYKSSHKLKNRLYDEGFKIKKCEECEITEWNGKPISLELDHINGDNTDELKIYEFYVQIAIVKLQHLEIKNECRSDEIGSTCKT